MGYMRLVPMKKIGSCLIILAVANLIYCSALEKDDQYLILTSSIAESVEYSHPGPANISSYAQIFKEIVSLTFELPRSKLTGKFIKRATLIFPQTDKLIHSNINIDTGDAKTEETECSNNIGNKTLILLKLSEKSKCDSLDYGIHYIPTSKNGTVKSEIEKQYCNESLCVDVENIVQKASICNDKLEGLNIDITSCGKNGNELQSFGDFNIVNLLIELSDGNCNFDEQCKWRNQSDETIHKRFKQDCCNIKHIYMRDNCNPCNTLQNSQNENMSNFTSGKYAELVPGSDQFISLFSPYLYGSSYGCSLQFSVLLDGDEFMVKIHSGYITRTVVVKNKGEIRWERIKIPIGRIDGVFNAEIHVNLEAVALKIDDINFEGCQNIQDSQMKPKCKENEFQCSTGLCISKDKVCDVVPDCFHGDDEGEKECADIPSWGRCSFESNTCNWTLDTSLDDQYCPWIRKSIEEVNGLKRLAANETKGHVMFAGSCHSSSLMQSMIFPAYNSSTGSCKIRFSYFFESIGDLKLQICYNSSNCHDHWNYDYESPQVWTRQVVDMPPLSKSYYLQFEATLGLRYVVIDNIAMTSGCFEGKPLDDLDPQVDQVNDEDMEIIMTSIGASIGIVLGVAMAIAILLVYKRYRGQFINKDPYRKVSAQSSSTSCSLIEEKLNFRDNSSLEHLDGSDGSSRPPSLAYSDIATTISPYYEWSSNDTDSIRNVPRRKIKLTRLLGKGAFGEVYYGLLADVAHIKGELPVAIKTLPSLCSEQTKSEFFFEALILSKFRHPNIVRFLGISVDEKSMLLILELMEGGDVRSFLRDSRPREPENPSTLCVQDLLKLATDIAMGCEYLEQNKFIHRDIAARNCLLTETGPKRIAKIGDFGMARDVFRTNYYRKNGIAMIPVKWMPPEAFMDGVFTVKTDVWAFGVALWEIFTMGFVPYPGRTNTEVMRFVADGGRLDYPSLCPEPMSELMKQCWESKPEDRPTFKYIVENLKTVNQNTHLLDKITLSDLKPKGAIKEENTTSFSSTVNYDALEKTCHPQKTVTADVHIVAL